MTKTVREIKRADELKPGDWLAAMQIDGDGDQPVEFLNSFPYSDADGDAVLLVYRVQDGVPRSIPADAYVKYQLATEGEVAAHHDQMRRSRIAEQLRELAALIVSKRLPIPGEYNHTSLTFHFGRDLDAVDRVAKELGIERTVSYGTGSVRWPSSGRREGLLDVSWESYVPKDAPETKPKPAPVPSAAPAEEPASVAECGCPVHPYPEGRGDGADTIVRHAEGVCTEDLA